MNAGIITMLLFSAVLLRGQTPAPLGPLPESTAAALYTEGNYWKLIELSKQTDVDTFPARFHFFLGMSYASLSEPQRAIEFLKRAIALDSTTLQYRYHAARILSQSGLYSEAVSLLETCIALDSTYVPARFQLGLTYAAQKNVPEKEIEIFSALVHRNPNDFLSLYYMAEALKRSGMADSAAATLRLSLQAHPRYHPALIAYSNYLNGQKLYVDALPYYLRADSVRGNNKDLLFQIGECFRRLGLLTEAKQYFRRAIAIDSMNGLYHAQLAYAHYSAEEYDSSAAEYQLAILYDEENAQYYLNLALVYGKLEMTDRVIAAYSKAVAVMHSERIASVHYELASYCYRQKLWKRAAEAYQRTIDIDPEVVDAYYYLGSTHMQLSRNRSAIQSFTEFLRRTENDQSHKGERTTAQKMIDYLSESQKKR